jgi:hypothetical protein
MKKEHFGPVSLALVTANAAVWYCSARVFELSGQNAENSEWFSLVLFVALAAAAFIFGGLGLFRSNRKIISAAGFLMSFAEILFGLFALWLAFEISKNMIDPKLIYPGN